MMKIFHEMEKIAHDQVVQLQVLRSGEAAREIQRIMETR